MKTTPTAATVQNFRCTNPAEVYAKHRSGTLSKKAAGDSKGAMTGISFADVLGQDQADRERPLHLKLESFLPILFQALMLSGLAEPNSQHEKLFAAALRKALALWAAAASKEEVKQKAKLRAGGSGEKEGAGASASEKEERA